MIWKVKSRNGKFYKVKNLMIEANDDGIYSVAFNCNYKLFNILSNPESDILGVQGFNLWKPCTHLIQSNSDEVPEYRIDGKVFSIQFQAFGF